jgi:hypothetical protein
MTFVILGVLVLVVCAVVALFAMFGELVGNLRAAGVLESTRVGAQLAVIEGSRVSPLPEAQIGAAPTDWPAPLSGLAARNQTSTILVLSTTCRSCDGVGAQLSVGSDDGYLADMGVLISCRSAADGDDFAQRHRLGRMPYYIDLDGRWVSTALGVRTSPAALFVKGGQLQDARTFVDLSALQTANLNGKEAVG